MEGGFQTLGLVGLGLIGGSMAKAAKAAGYRVLAIDRDAHVMEQAREDGVLDGLLSPETAGDCDILLPALYPGATVAYLREIAPHCRSGCVITDLCGVKRAVSELSELAQTHGLFYVGGHPMAGAEKVGYVHARETLFAGASMILTPTPETPLALREALALFFASLGFGGIKWSSAEEHDRVIAYTSQLSHVLSSAYIKSPTAPMQAGFSAGSFRDMTRVAWLNEEMWTELFLDNADYLAEEVEGMAARLLDYAAAIRAGAREPLRQMLREGRLRKEEIDAG